MSTQIQIASSGGGNITVGTTPVTSGTNGRVFFQAGGVVQQDGAFNWDNTNKRLGIGANATSPTAALYIRTNLTSANDVLDIQNGQYGNPLFRIRDMSTASPIANFFFSGLILGGNSGVTRRFDLGGFGLGASFGDSASNAVWENNQGNIGDGQGTSVIAVSSNLYVNQQTTKKYKFEAVTGNFGIGNVGTLGARLDVRAQGALSTDIAFRVRNSGDTTNLIESRGNGHLIVSNSNFADVFTAQNSLESFRVGGGNLNYVRTTQSGNLTFIIRNGASSNALITLNAGAGNSVFWENLFGFETTTKNLTVFGGSAISGGNSGNSVMWVRSGTSTPSASFADMFGIYSADITADNAAPHFRTENGSIIKLYQNASVTTSQGVADALTNLGLLATSVIDFIPVPDAYEIFRGRTFRYDSTTVDTYAGIATLNNASSLGQITGTTNFYQKFVRLRYYRTTVSTGIMTSVRSTDLQWYVGGGFRFVTTFRVSDTAFSSNCQQFYGLAGTTAELVYGGVSQVLVRTNLNIIGVGSDNGDTNLQIFYNDASGNDASKIDLGVNFPANRTAGAEMTTMYSIQIYNEVNSSQVKYEVINLETGAIAQGTLTTDLPAATQGLSIHATRAAGSPITGTGQFELHKWGCSDIIK